MSRRMFIRVISFSLSVTVIAISLAVYGISDARRAHNELSANYNRAVYELAARMSQIDFALTKSRYATSPALMSALSSEVFRASSLAAASIGQLPLNDAGLAGTAKFISQVGDYSYSLSRRAAAGKTLTDAERKTLAKLSHNAAELSGSLENLAANGTRGLSGAGTSFSADLSELEAQFPEYPTLIYDGPFSEHLLNRKYAFLEGKPACTIDEARKRAAAFLGVSPAALKTNGKKSGGALPVFTFSYGSASVDVTEIGCSVLSMLDSRTPARATLTADAAIARAAAFLKKCGYNSLAASYYTKYSGTIMINFAPHEGGVMLYPDLVKITIALDTGAVANFEAQGYITNHKDRTLPKPKISAAAARTRVPRGLKLLSTSLTLIPGDGERETLAYELKCRDADGKHILVYIDAQTGDEIRILVLIEDENGTLVM